MQTRNRIGAGILSICLLFSLSGALPVFAAKVEEATIDTAAQTSPEEQEDKALAREIHISTAEEFYAFAESCGLDDYSRGLRVYLNNDIELSGEYEPAPLFFGSFDGQGHSIDLLSVTGKGSDMGLFRYICQGAVVENLTVSGVVKTSGSASGLGFIAGQNAGKIVNCKVSGIVQGKDDVGGVVGINTKEGSLINCKSSATVSGTHRSGGIAGSNSGLLEGCVNDGKINTTISSTDERSLALDISGLTGEPAATVELADISDSGGVAGFNDGAIRYCTNTGLVGYKHLGYNTGGIAGRHSGIIKGCTNKGEILGRKDVGGIVGQMEPHITLKFDGSGAEDLRSQLSELSGALRLLSSQVNSVADETLMNAEDINKAVGSIEDALKEHKDGADGDIENTGDAVYKSLQTINAAGGRILEYIQTYTREADFQLAIINKEFKNIAVNLQTISENATKAMDEINKQSDNISQSLSKIGEAMGNFEKLVGELSDIMNDPGMSEIEKTEAAKEALKQYGDTIDLASVGTELKNISEAMKIINDNIKIINDSIKTGTTEINGSLIKIADAQEALRIATRKFSDDMTADLQLINTEMDKLEDVLYGYAGNASERLDKTFDILYKQLQTINTGMGKIVDAGIEGNKQITNTVNTVINIFERLGNTFADTLSGPTYTVEDISEKMVENEEASQISVSENQGAVTADINVGGVVGIMALEAGNDPEEDYALNESLWGSTTALFRAAVLNSANNGAVTAKNGCTGGVVGRCDIGAVYQSKNTGRVEALNGALCGGIVGQSTATVVNCDAYCRLFGTDEVGGIAGRGVDIKNCRALVKITGEGEKQGAIAGSASGEVSDNSFVFRGLYGVDGLSYSKAAQPLSYQAFINKEGTPSLFKELKIDFVLNGFLLASIPVSYGGSINEKDIPQIPSRPDAYGKWGDFEREDIFGSMTVEGTYYPWISTITSGGKLPLMLAQGEFSEDARLTATQLEELPAVPDGYAPVAAYEYSLSDSGREPSETFELRIRCDEAEKLQLGIINQDGVTLTSHTVDGSCLVFEGGSSGEIVLMRRQGNMGLYFLCGGAAVLLAVWILLRKKAKNKKAKH